MAEAPTVTISLPPIQDRCPTCHERYVFLEHPMRPGVPMMATCACTRGPDHKWDKRFLELAQLISTWSKDPSTQVGCVLVGKGRAIHSTGYNGFPRGVADDDRLHDREKKYPLVVHAEENAVLNATSTGASLNGCVSYGTWPPCTRCARLYIQAGVREVVSPKKDIPERWQADFDRARGFLIEAGVKVRVVDVG